MRPLIGILCCFLFAVVSAVNAQSADYPLKKRLTLFGGLSVPLSELASSSFAYAETGQADGFATSGYDFGLEFSDDITHSIEIGFLASANILGFDETQYASRMRATDIIIRDKWILADLVGIVGLYKTTSQGVTYYGRLFVGLLFGERPSITMHRETTPGIPTLWDEWSSTAYPIRYGIGGGVRILNRLDFGTRLFLGAATYQIYPTYDKPPTFKNSITISSPTLQLFLGVNILTREAN